VRDAVLRGAAAAILAHDSAALDAFPAALTEAARSVDSGTAARTLDTWVRLVSPGS
jgi:anthranilate phosphoribosyltransferase